MNEFKETLISSKMINLLNNIAEQRVFVLLVKAFEEKKDAKIS